MNSTSQKTLSFILYFIFFLFAVILQTSLFHWIIGGRSTVQLAIVIMTYICLYRGKYEAILFSFFASYCLGLMSTMAESVSVFSGLCLYFANRAIKKQFYAPGSTHFLRVAVANVFFFHFISFIVSYIFEPAPPLFRPLDWLLEVLLTALFIKTTYSFFVFVDQKTKRIEVSELERR